MGKLIKFIFLITYFFSPMFAYPLNINISSEAAILMNADTGAILYEKNSHQKLYPASITKIATTSYIIKIRGNKLDTLVAAEHDCIASISSEAKIRSNFSLPAHWLEQGSTHMGIKKGEILSLLDLLYGTMLVSGNDSANVLAHFIGGTVPNFMQDLNAYLKEIGCQNTHFCNPNGLHHPKHVTTAYDMAIITKEALKDPLFRDIVSSTKYIRPKTNKQESTVLVQGNRLIRKGEHFYPLAMGVKTGYTSQANHTLVAAAKQQNRTLIAVLLNCKEKGGAYKDAKALFEAAFNEKEATKRILSKGIQKFFGYVPNTKIALKPYIKEDVLLKYFPSEKGNFKCQIKWEVTDLPVNKHQRIGTVTLSDSKNMTVKVIPLFAAENLSKGWKTNLIALPIYWKFVILVGVILFPAILIFYFSKK